MGHVTRLPGHLVRLALAEFAIIFSQPLPTSQQPPPATGPSPTYATSNAAAQKNSPLSDIFVGGQRGRWSEKGLLTVLITTVTHAECKMLRKHKMQTQTATYYPTTL